jgi:histidinol-phosphate aminotransferase
VLPSAANFVFTRHPGRTGAALAAALREQGVLVRHFDKPRIADYLRISVGTSSDTNRLIAALTLHLGSNSADQSAGPT